MTLILLALTFLRRKIWDEAYLLHTFPPESEVKKVHRPFFLLFGLSNYLVSGFLIPLSDVC